MRSARPRKFYAIPSIVDVRMRPAQATRTKWRRACAKARKGERAREGENERIHERFLRMNDLGIGVDARARRRANGLIE